MAVYEDEVDVYLNPKIGLDRMVSGQQREVLTPEKKRKAVLGRRENTRTGELLWVEGDLKNSLLFVRLLWELTQHYRST